MSGTRPNILFFQVDQLAAHVLRAYGDPACLTPNLDALAARGKVFDTCYCNFPLCAPSRASMAAGRLCSAIGAYDNAAELAASTPTYAHHLAAAGYRTALSGKMHFIGPDQHHGFHDRLTADLYPADFAWAPNWADEGKRDTNDARSVTVSGVCARSVQIEFDEEVTFHAERYLYDRAAKQDGPFFLQVSYTHPHEPYLCLQEFWDLYEDAPIPDPAVPALTEKEHDAHSVRILRDFGMLDAPISTEDVTRARRAYYGAVSYVDSLVGRVLGALDRAGLTDNTVILFTSDHGDFLGERGMWFKKHFYEPSIRVPLMIAGTGITSGRCETPVSLVDLLPTFAALAGAPAPDDTDGTDILSLDPDPDRVICAEYLAEATSAPIVMVRKGAWKYIHSEDDPPLLYNLASDPNETQNLASDPAHADTLAAMQDEVRARWDLPALKAAILHSQAQRRLIRQAHATGGTPRWNHGEVAGQDVRWYRGDGGYSNWAFDYLPPQDDG
ncbi:choline-sulfatase [Pseudaestuariivita atlantica]|uniref:choline-sulfatase n=1 Tax=Pseudaestuariivita atlantica TaxID=1317121 RepID=UPI00067C940D|nr:choline-sulfatase [Pseudaestuariivita atlantica]